MSIMEFRRGPKTNTRINNGALRITGTVEPTRKLKRRERTEFDRLVRLLQQRGTFEKVELSTITYAATYKILLDDELARPEPRMRQLSTLSNLHRNRLRDLGLPLQPSRAKHRVNEASGLRRFDHLLGEADNA
jgi:hypothetical protein